MTRNQAEVAALKFCAERRGVSERAVRTWRKTGDPRWLADRKEWERKMGFEFREQLEADAARNDGPSYRDDDEDPAGLETPVDDGLGDGLAAEIMRSRRECKDLALAWRAAFSARKYLTAEQINRQLDSKRDTLRKLESDAAKIGMELGDVVPKTLVTNYAADVAGRAAALERRLITLLPLDTTDEVRARLGREIDAFREECVRIELRAA